MGCSSSSIAAKNATPDWAHGFHDAYILRKKIGAGSFAQVYAATNTTKQDRSENAVKVIATMGKSRDKTDLLLSAARREEALWMTVGRHENCVHLLEVFYEATFCYMVMEKCDRSLQAHLEQVPSLTERSLGDIFSQMLVGISHLHSVNVVHRDIKPDNFLVNGSSAPTVKMCDFGLAAPLIDGQCLRGVVGTAPFISPEMLLGEAYNEKADMWSFAVTCYCLLFGEFPYNSEVKNSRHMKMATIEGKPVAFAPVEPTLSVASYSGPAVDFVKKMLIRPYASRPSASGALRMEYMMAASQKRHALEVVLPSLRPILRHALNNGVFQRCDISEFSRVDAYVNMIQAEKHGVLLGQGDLDSEKIRNDDYCWAINSSERVEKSRSEDQRLADTSMGSRSVRREDFVRKLQQCVVDLKQQQDRDTSTVYYESSFATSGTSSYSIATSHRKKSLLSL